MMKIREIKYLRKFTFYIDSNSKSSRFNSEIKYLQKWK